MKITTNKITTNKITTNRWLVGGGYGILGILTAVGPHVIFPVCEAMGGNYMKCHWTAQAEIGVGAVMTALGVLLFLSSHEEVQRGIQIALLPLSILVLLIPDVLIGMCGSNHMRCRSLTLPALNVIGGIAILIGLIHLIYLWKRKERT